MQTVAPVILYIIKSERIIEATLWNLHAPFGFKYRASVLVELIWRAIYVHVHVSL